MGVISSTIKLMDASTSPIMRTIGAMNKMVDVIEQVNKNSDMPNLDKSLAEIRTEVSLATHDVDRFREKLEQTGNEGVHHTGRVSGGFGLISRSIIVVNQGLQLLRMGYQALDQAMSKADDRNSADARLSLIRDEVRTQEQLESQVMRVANATRTSYEDTATLIARIGRQDYFKGQNDKALAFSRTISQALKVSGASTTESSSAVIQLSQALASGVLRGDEFNAIMENGSEIGKAMAESLGVTSGELRAMAADGLLTTDVVVSSIMAQADSINEEFSSMPISFAESKVQMANIWSQLLNDLSEPGEGLNKIINTMQEFIAWLNTMEGKQFLGGMAQGVSLVFEGMLKLMQVAGEIYGFFNDNWTTIEPILIGLGVAVGGVTAAYMIYKGVLLATQIIELAQATATAVKTGATLVDTSATAAATAAQWGLNAALLANPITWVVIAIIALIAIIIALSIWLYKLWQTNIDFRVGVISIWNGILNFFDQVPIFFMGVGYGIADAFSYAKVTVAMILQAMVNDAIAKINWLINAVNKIPGVAIETVAEVTFGTEVAVEEEAARQQRADSLQGSRDAATERAAQREADLRASEAMWREEAAQKEAELAAAEEENNKKAGDSPFVNEPDFGEVSLGGGDIDKVGKVGKIEDSVDLSNQSVAYLRDIAEIYALESVNAYSTVSYEAMNSAQLSPADADLLRSSAGGDTKVYYLNYSGGVSIRNDVKKGENWDDIRRQMEEEIDNDIESGLSDIDKVVNG